VDCDCGFVCVIDAAVMIHCSFSGESLWLVLFFDNLAA
jgi:hypothetical protein